MADEPCSLADLEAGHEGRIAGLRLGRGARLEERSPLRVGAHVYVVEASGRGWQHVRIGHREYSVPRRVAERILVDAPALRRVTCAEVVPGVPAPAPGTARGDHERHARGGEPAGATKRYEILLTRRRRSGWRVLVVERRGTIVRSLIFDDRDTARTVWEALRSEAESTSAAEFRTRHGLP